MDYRCYLVKLSIHGTTTAKIDKSSRDKTERILVTFADIFL
jgi:hypothetical protein